MTTTFLVMNFGSQTPEPDTVLEIRIPSLAWHPFLISFSMIHMLSSSILVYRIQQLKERLLAPLSDSEVEDIKLISRHITRCFLWDFGFLSFCFSFHFTLWFHRQSLILLGTQVFQVKWYNVDPKFGQILLFNHL